MPVVTDYTAILSGQTWNGPAVSGRPVFLTYSFETAPASYLTGSYSTPFLGSFAPLSAADQATARAALGQWADASGVTFFEVPAGQGDIRFGKYDFQFAPTPALRAADGFTPFPSVLVSGTTVSDNLSGGDVFLSRAGTPTPYLLLHEIGHALGLKHSFEDGTVTLDPAIDDTAHTVMSYTNRSGAPTTRLGPLDVQAIQALYGGPAADGTQVTSWSWDPTRYILTETGGPGNDTILGVGAGDVIHGGAGADVLAGQNGDDALFGDDGGDRLYGSFGSDTLDGGAGDDTLQGGDGYNVLRGGAGDDSLSVAGGLSILDGGDGVDRLAYGSNLPTPQRLDFAGLVAAGGVIGIEQVSLVAGAGADTIVGSDMAETISGGGGADVISAGGGDDVINVFRGVASVDGGAGFDGLVVTIFGANGAGASFDAAELRVTNVELVTYVGSFADDTLVGGDAGESLAGGAGNDQVFGRLGADTISGGAGTNYLRGDEGDDSIVGGTGFDDANGNMGNDTVSTGDGDDYCVGGKDNDSLAGGAGYDLVYGNLGADTCDGGDGNDIVRGGQDNDVVMGGNGDDFVSGDRGDDTMTGGAGADVFHSFSGAGIDRVIDFSLAQGDRVMLDPGTTYVLRQVGADTVVDLGGGDQVILVGVPMSSLSAGSIFIG